MSRSSVAVALASALAAAWPDPALAVLNEHCVVSVLNRSAQVQADGSWVLPNVPANIGRVRVRATCVENGVTRSGQSGYLVVPPNGAIRVGDILLDALEPVPSQLVLTAPSTTLQAVGATVQLTATATYPDTHTADVTAASAGTNYTSTNARIASIGENGLVTAASSGTVIITALNDGASALLRVSVVLGGDSDGDGISDDIELANGLNPNDPVDALEDFDHDGLTNRQELVLGTDIRAADTDGDGLPDGREVDPSIGSDPLVFDTDGDGLGDGLEVATGSDPRSASSYNLSRALQFIEVRPTVVALVVNTLLGQASRQLQVTGHLIDGRTLDLTSSTRGTNYLSSDLAIVNFGATDGELFAGSDGSATVTVGNGGFSATVQVSVRTFSPRAVSFVSVPGFANNVDVAGSYAYVAAGSAGLQVVDVASRASPRIAGSLALAGNANDVVVAGNVAYVAGGTAGLHLVDVSNPLAPALLGTLGGLGNAQDVVVRGTRAYVAGGASGLSIVDVSNPRSPVRIGGLATSNARGVDATGNLAAVADGSSLRAIDVTTPTSPVLRGTLALSDARDVVLDGAVAYVADFSGSLRIVDLSTPATPRLLASTSTSLGGILTDVAKVRNFILGADVFFVNGVPITEVSDPASPQVRARLDFPARDDNGTGIAADNSYVYLTAERGITENGVTGDTRLYIGQYLEVTDDAGVPPTVAITSPAAGSEHIAGTTASVRAEATDDVGVAGVTFSVDGVPVSTDFTAPFEFSYTFPPDAISVTFGATAVDFGGNQGDATPVEVRVIPDPAPVVAITSPAEGADLIEGQTVTLRATATDNVRVTQVAFTVNGATQPAGSFSQPSVTHTQSYAIPLGTTSLAITASATDNLGQVGSASRTLAVRPDPRTTVTGRVLDEQLQPVEGAGVSVFGEFTAQTVADGSFAIPNVPTVRGDIVAVAEVMRGGERFSGTSPTVSPVRGGITDVGTFQIAAQRFETQIGALIARAAFGSLDDGFAVVSLPFPFTFYGTEQTQVYVGTNGYLTFGSGDTTFSESVSGFANSRPRLAVIFNDWISNQDATGGIYLNTQLPGRFVVTWQQVRLFSTTQRATFQAVLYADGRIQFGYDAVQPRDGLVGITPGSFPATQLVDFSRTPSFSVDGRTAPYEQFFGVGNRPFDLEQTLITFTPAAGGGYDGRPRVPLPTVVLTSPAAGTQLVEGETGTLAATATGQIAQVGFAMSGVPLLPDTTAPYMQSFMAPLGVTGLTLTATATDVVSQTASASRTVTVVPELFTSVRGNTVDAAGNAIAGANVVLEMNGLKGEFFDYDSPLTALPDLTGRTPTTTRLVSSIDFRNPGQIFNADTFGTGLAPHFAARFTGLIKVSSGAYRFYLAANDGARLRVAGTTVVEIAPSAALTEGSGLINLNSGSHPIEIQYVQNQGDAELQLSYAPPGLERQTVPSAALLVNPPAFAAVTDAAGAFAFTNVPTALGKIRVTATATVGDQGLVGSVERPPVRGGLTDFGPVALTVPARVVGYYDLTFNQGVSSQVAPITTAGLEAVNVGNLDAADLSAFHILFVQNPDNSGYSFTYRNNLGRLFDWVSNGGVLVFHDRHVDTAETVLPGAPGNIVRDFADPANVEIVDDTTAVTHGPGGTLTNTSLDGGNSSSHGFVAAASAPAGAIGVLSRGNHSELVLYAYPFGRGWVVYSTMPLDFYLGGTFGVSGNFSNVYAPNVIAFARDLRQRPVGALQATSPARWAAAR